MVAISRAPLSKLETYKKRMGWSFKWLSSGETDFNFDFHASFPPEVVKKGRVFFNYAEVEEDFTDREGASAFYRDPSGRIFHTYSTFARGIDLMNTAYNWLDIVPNGRGENGGGPFWVRRHDEYQPATLVSLQSANEHK